MKYDCETESICVAPVQDFMKEKEEKLDIVGKNMYIYIQKEKTLT